MHNPYPYQEEGYTSQLHEKMRLPYPYHAPFKYLGTLVDSAPAQLSRSTASMEHFTLVRKWLDTCRAFDKFCNQRKRRSGLPSRLVDVGVPEKLVQPHLFIPSAAETTNGIVYLTLSHVWGDPVNMFKLTSGNMDELLRGIDLDRLSKTFRDAIMITRRLGYRYLWIDSLCIVQDSPADWATESVRMADTYGNSELNIGALAGNSHHGCFRTRNPLCYRPCKLLPEVYAARNLPDHKDQSYPEASPLSPLLTRAWVFQERVLDPRTVYYGELELYWECCSKVATESWPHGVHQPGRHHSKSRFEKILQLELDKQFKEERVLPNFIADWHLMVQQYSRAALTFSTDRPIAIAGIVQALQERTGYQHCNGLWSGYLLNEPAPKYLLGELLWRHAPTHDPLEVRLLRNSQTPSWSWISVDGPVSYDLLAHNHFGGYTTSYSATVLTKVAALKGSGDHLLTLKAQLMPIAQCPLPMPAFSSGQSHDNSYVETTEDVTMHLFLTIYRDSVLTLNPASVMCLMLRTCEEDHSHQGIVWYR